MEDREERAEKVGAGGTAAWLFEAWEKARKRDQAVLAGLRARTDAAVMGVQRHYRMRQVLVFVSGVALGGALAAIYFMEVWK